MTSGEQALHYRGPVIGESRPVLAVGGGILAGLATLGVVVGLLTLFGGDSTDAGSDGRPGPGQAIRPSALLVGDCIEPGTGATATILLRSCEAPHPAQVTGSLPYPTPADDYPGAERLSLFVGQQCERRADQYLGTSLLATTLASEHVIPSLNDWSNNDTAITCYIARSDGADLTASLEGRGLDFPRGTQVPVSRLMVGDCFIPADGVDSYALNSNSTVDLVPCDGRYNGVFFGRDILDQAGTGSDFPGDDEIGMLTSDRCADLFETTYGEPADGFNYRYWRPNQQSWNLGDRGILCAVLDADPLSGRFDPGRYEPFFELAAGECFDLGPEETDASLGLDDQVMPVDCGGAHAGQIIGAGLLEADGAAPYPGEEEVEDLAGARCELLFEGFVGISPFESELVNFPFWYPNEIGWGQGDRRFACAFLDEVERVGSLEGAGL
jgi:hypothetical protein